jgi:ubiquinone/menaquinone biosynthesis C-methylase UbiE
MAEQHYAQSVSANYTPGDLAEKIMAGLRAAGKDPDALTLEDLAPIDQFHLGGMRATRELMQRAGIVKGMRVLDVGGGLGGPARTLAVETVCTVTVLDLTAEYCAVGEMLTARTGLSDRVAFRHGNALDMPFSEDAFDAVWTQHSTMNIEEKERLFTEIHRVLRPGGRLALHEVMAGPVQPIHYPVPWARDATINFLRPPESVRILLAATGFTEIAWIDVTAPALAAFQAAVARATSAPEDAPPFGLNLLLDNFAARGSNQVRNLAEHRTSIIQGVFERP